MTLKAVIFDLGDTLTNHHKEKVNPFRSKLLRKYGYPISENQLKQASEATKTKFLKKYYGSVEVHKSRNNFRMKLQYLGYKPEESTLIKMEKEDSKFWRENVSLYPGAESILKHCKSKGLKIAVISNSTRGGFRKIVKRLGIHRYFDFVLISQEIGYEKSSLVPFKMALKKLKVKPEECLMVGNRPDEDMKAKNVGIRTCLVEYFKFPLGGKPEKPDFKINDIRDLKGIIDKLTEK